MCRRTARASSHQPLSPPTRPSLPRTSTRACAWTTFWAPRRPKRWWRRPSSCEWRYQGGRAVPGGGPPAAGGSGMVGGRFGEGPSRAISAALAAASPSLPGRFSRPDVFRFADPHAPPSAATWRPTWRRPTASRSRMFDHSLTARSLARPGWPGDSCGPPWQRPPLPRTPRPLARRRLASPRRPLRIPSEDVSGPPTRAASPPPGPLISLPAVLPAPRTGL